MRTEEVWQLLKRGEWEPNVGVILLPSGKKVGPLIDIAGTVHCGEHSGEFPRIAGHALLVREREASGFVAKIAGLAELSPPPAPAVA